MISVGKVTEAIEFRLQRQLFQQLTITSQPTIYIMKFFILSVTLLLVPLKRIAAQTIYTSREGHVSFFADAPITNVDAHNHKAKITLNISTGDLTVDIAMANFEFKNRKMGRDARRNYIEIDEFPKANFTGKITSKIDPDRPGTFNVSAIGILQIHGKEREVTERGIIKIEGGQLSLHSEFNVVMKDYNIETPKILGQEMTENDAIVKVDAVLSPEPK
jgi:polyisoprenoid-binding protein YceI